MNQAPRPPAGPPPGPRQYRVFVVDDHLLLRRALVDAITRDPNLTVCGQAGDVPEALAGIAALRPDIVLTDIQLKTTSGLDLIKTLRTRSATLPIVAASLFELVQTRQLACSAGATEFIGKQHGPEKIINLLHEVMAARPRQ
jgi:two-component system response regulator DevR